MKARRSTSGLPRAGGAATPGRRNPLGATAGRGSRVRDWPVAGTASRTAAKERAEADALQQGVRYRRLFVALLGTIVALSAVIVLLGTAGLFRETRSRPLTAEEQSRYKQEEIARRWQAWPATSVFPEEVKYFGLDRVQQYARRVGIAPEAACRSAVDSSIAGILDGHGCRTMLRATYVDQTSTFVMTVGVAVLEDEEARVSAAEELTQDDRVGVLPVAFPGTVAERFGPRSASAPAGWAPGRTSSSRPRATPTAAPGPPSRRRRSCTASSGRRPGRSATRSPTSSADPPKVPPCTQGNVC